MATNTFGMVGVITSLVHYWLAIYGDYYLTLLYLGSGPNQAMDSLSEISNISGLLPAFRVISRRCRNAFPCRAGMTRRVLVMCSGPTQLMWIILLGTYGHSLERVLGEHAQISWSVRSGNRHKFLGACARGTYTVSLERVLGEHNTQIPWSVCSGNIHKFLGACARGTYTVSLERVLGEHNSTQIPWSVCSGNMHKVLGACALGKLLTRCSVCWSCAAEAGIAGMMRRVLVMGSGKVINGHGFCPSDSGSSFFTMVVLTSYTARRYV